MPLREGVTREGMEHKTADPNRGRRAGIVPPTPVFVGASASGGSWGHPPATPGLNPKTTSDIMQEVRRC